MQKSLQRCAGLTKNMCWINKESALRLIDEERAEAQQIVRVGIEKDYKAKFNELMDDMEELLLDQENWKY